MVLLAFAYWLLLFLNLFFCLLFFFFFFFFFSSRRRHTRSLCDWSSDVCSSDLPCWFACTRTSMVCPPLTMSETFVLTCSSPSVSSKKGESKCPSRWLIAR